MFDAPSEVNERDSRMGSGRGEDDVALDLKIQKRESNAWGLVDTATGFFGESVDRQSPFAEHNGESPFAEHNGEYPFAEHNGEYPFGT